MGYPIQLKEAVIKKAKSMNPERWSGRTRNWQPVSEVILKKFKKVEQSAQPLKKVA